MSNYLFISIWLYLECLRHLKHKRCRCLSFLEHRVWEYSTQILKTIKQQASIVQTVDSAIYWINNYPVGKV